MKTTLRIVMVHLFVTVFLWALASIESFFQCGGLCGPITFFSAIAFFVFILPGYKIVGFLIPYAPDESGAVSLVREFVSLVTTEATLIATIFVWIKIFTYVRKRDWF
jgi:hypothetical protein